MKLWSMNGSYYLRGSEKRVHFLRQCGSIRLDGIDSQIMLVGIGRLWGYLGSQVLSKKKLLGMSTNGVGSFPGLQHRDSC